MVIISPRAPVGAARPAEPEALTELGRLAYRVLADMGAAPPTDLARLLAADEGAAAGAGAAVRPARSLVHRFASGVGTAATRVAPIPEAPAAEERADDDMPELFCPGPVRDDPALGERVNEGIVAWAEEVGIYPGQLDRLRKCDFGSLIMLTHPACDDPDRLLAAAKCVVAEWAADDYFVDEVDLGADPMIVGSRMAKLHAVVDPARLPAAYEPQLDEWRRDTPIATAFRTAMEHLARYTSNSQMGRFQHQMAILFTAWNQEADWHNNRRTPPVWEYLVQRHLNSYLPPMILIDAVGGYELTPEEFYDPRFRRAFTLAGDANVLLNDLHSSKFESETDHNLPSVIAAEDGCTPREAIKRTIEIHNELMRTFVTEAAALSLVGTPNLRRFLADTWAWLGGSREWHSRTGRYHS
jgi:2-methylisoborneol synthase